MTGERNRNGEQWTEPMFWSWIRSVLRKASVKWGPWGEAMLVGRRKNQSENKRLRWEHQCATCKQWFQWKKGIIQMDHIVPVGPLNCAEDLPGFVERLFCEINGYQKICTGCHQVKTALEKESRKCQNNNTCT